MGNVLSSDQNTELLTVSEACEKLRVSKPTLYRLMRAKKIASIKLGRRRLVDMQSIRELIGRLKQEGEG
jgi:excisionase family DNA binding protein